MSVKKNYGFIEKQVNNPIIHGDFYFIKNRKRKIPFALNTLPNIDTEYVVGRNFDIIEVHKLLTTSKKVVLVNGIGGIGKTTVAKALLEKYKKEFKHIAWIEIPKNGNIKEAFAYNVQLIDSLVIDNENSIKKEKNFINEIYEIIINRLRQLKGVNLLIIDNVRKDLENEIDNISLGQNWNVLVTSRHKLEKIVEYNLDFLPPEEAMKLFYLHYKREINDEIVNSILKKIEYHTLAIELLAKTAEKSKLELKKVYSKYKMKGLNISEKTTISTQHSKNQVERVFDYIVNIFNLDDLDEMELNILTHFSFLPSINISYNAIVNLFLLDNRDDNWRDNFVDSLNKVCEKGWIKEQRENYYSHPIISEVIRYKTMPQIDTFNDMIDVLVKKLDIIQGVNPLANLEYLTIANSILEFSSSYNTKSAKLCNLTGNLYLKLGNYSNALNFHKKAVSYFEKNEHIYPIELAKSYDLIAVSYIKSSDYKKAMDVNLKALKIKEINLGSSSPELAATYVFIANTFFLFGKYEKAIEIINKADAIYNNSQSEASNLIANYRNIGKVYLRLHIFDKALEYHKKSLELKLKKLDNNHPNIAVSYNGIAGTYRGLNDFINSIAFHDKAINVLLNQEKPHPSLGASYNNLARTYCHFKKYREAIKFHNKALRFQINILGKKNVDLIRTYHNLSTTYRQHKKLSLSLDNINKAILLQKEVFDEHHKTLADLFFEKAITLSLIGDSEEALLILESAIKIYKLTLPEDHPSIQNAIKIFTKKNFCDEYL